MTLENLKISKWGNVAFYNERIYEKGTRFLISYGMVEGLLYTTYTDNRKTRFYALGLHGLKAINETP